MADNIPHSLEIDKEFRIADFTHKSLSIFVGGGEFSVEVSNDGILFHAIRTGITSDVLIRTGEAATDLPHKAELIKITQQSGGTDPRFTLSLHDPA